MAIHWGGTIQGQQLYGAYGTRDIVIISQEDTLTAQDVVPRRSAQLTEEDLKKLGRLGLSQESSHDDSSIMAARIALDKEYSLVANERSRPGETLTKDYILDRISQAMKSTTKDGLTIYYFGPGKKKTGDWCFIDGFITFKELTELYMDHFRGRVLTIHSDCSYGGQWGKALMEFLDEQGIQPCGHHARHKKILLKAFTSCKANEIPHCLIYSLRGNDNDKNTGLLACVPNGTELHENQHINLLDTTYLRCNNKSIGEACRLPPDYTWKRWSECDRVFLVRGKDSGRSAWYYVLLEDDEDVIQRFHDEIKGENLNLSEFGEIIKSGYGEDPPNQVKDWIDERYRTSNT